MTRVVSSTSKSAVPQKDGRIWVYETHTLDTGEVRQRQFLADATLDLDWHLALTASQINESLRPAETSPESVLALESTPVSKEANPPSWLAKVGHWFKKN